jgi:uncharacterized protein YaiE (UPF0345 family)
MFFLCQSRTKNLHFAKATFPGFSAMEIMAGELEVLLPETEQWQSIDAGESFTVPGDAKFQIRIKTPADYCCSYLA